MPRQQFDSIIGSIVSVKSIARDIKRKDGSGAFDKYEVRFTGIKDSFQELVDAGKPSWFEQNIGKEGEFKFKENSFTDKTGVQRTNRTIYSPLPPRRYSGRPSSGDRFDVIMAAIAEIRDELKSLDVPRKR